MSRKKFIPKDGIVYSTDSDFPFENESAAEEDVAADLQQPRVLLDKKQRAGKSVTLITKLELTEDSLQKLGKELKNLCGTGGSVKDGEVLLQGDFRKKVLDYLLKKGFKKTKII